MENVPTHVALGRIREVVDGGIAGRTDLRILDAGCGADSARAGFPVPRGFENAHVVGIDVDREALEANSLLKERLVVDIQTADIPAGSYDLVVCWDVLEHLPDPMRAVDRLARAVRPGGIIVVGVPNLASLKGVLTKVTPFWFHRFVYRHVFRAEIDPYPTFLRGTMRPERLRLAFEERGFDTELALLYGADHVDATFGRRRVLARLWKLAIRTARILTLGKSDPGASDAAMIFRRRELSL